jgi:hypothetical protein
MVGNFYMDDHLVIKLFACLLDSRYHLRLKLQLIVISTKTNVDIKSATAAVNSGGSAAERHTKYSSVWQ